ncbi:hypothetical protein EHQ92_12935 [Leptospira biflexa]|uniref:hypothetical protein n=1 Tax=Leptospira biflexa TaxID=172 RepID=UPI0010824B02|nr:hypothetical protein [Leptospira biflexa]TGM31716.1 hypothetical protein EHQ89_17095 [Leptospira biflexa]TGM39125.1 hypothetical protein EHQ80_04015 [Leptospira biflexa]TGM44537.1 hypothetical protein EHQ92_12935 [Leptospira biflexa]TGM45422.1 hypothetical protein EHQ88_14565 [Leptospira biflexa]TGM53976.1 hypothetical protein EHQ91_02955 [Leptospira biflexa]
MNHQFGEKPSDIYLIVDRPLDHRFWKYWIFELKGELNVNFIVIQLTYVHTFLKDQQVILPTDQNRIQVNQFSNETHVLDFFKGIVNKKSLVFFYTWVAPNAFMELFTYVDQNFENYYYLMHGLGDNTNDHPVISNIFNKIRITYKKLRFSFGMKRRFRGPKYWLDSTKMRIKAQYPYLGPLGYRTKRIVTGNHFLARFLEAQALPKQDIISKHKKSVLWLDQNLPNVHQFGYKIEVDPKNYYRGLRNIFEHLKSIGFDVYLTVHPDTTEQEKQKLESGYLQNSAKILKLPSEIAAMEVNLILTHDSTASYFGVLAKKPIVNLMYEHLKDELMIQSIVGLSKALKTPLISFDENEFDPIDFESVTINKESYRKFQNQYILGEQTLSPYEYMKTLIKKEIESGK